MLNLEKLIGITTVDHTVVVARIKSGLQMLCLELVHVAASRNGSASEFCVRLCQNSRFSESHFCSVFAFPCSPLSLHLLPLSNSLTWCVTHLSPRAVFKDNHVDREVTRRHCHPLCPVPVAAAVELLPTSPLFSFIDLFCLSSLCQCFNTPSYFPIHPKGKGKTKKNPPKH